MITLKLRIENKKQSEMQLKIYMERQLRKFLLGYAEAVADLAGWRLEGKFGEQYSHQYWNDDLGRIVDRFLIKHYQTGRLAESFETNMISPTTAEVVNKAVSSSTGDHYALPIALLDQKEVGQDYLLWAGERAKDLLKRTKRIGDVYDDVALRFI